MVSSNSQMPKTKMMKKKNNVVPYCLYMKILLGRTDESFYSNFFPSLNDKINV